MNTSLSDDVAGCDAGPVKLRARYCLTHTTVAGSMPPISVPTYDCPPAIVWRNSRRLYLAILQMHRFRLQRLDVAHRDLPRAQVAGDIEFASLSYRQKMETVS